MTEQFFESPKQDDPSKNDGSREIVSPETGSVLTLSDLVNADGSLVKGTERNPGKEPGKESGKGVGEDTGLLKPDLALSPSAGANEMSLSRLKDGDELLSRIEPGSTDRADAYARELNHTIRIESEPDAYGDRSDFSKIMDIGTGAVLDSPAEYYSQLKSDFTHQPYKVAQNAAIGTGIGLGATSLLKVAPKKGKLALGALLAGQALHYGSEAVSFFSRATDARNTYERDMLIRAGSRGLAREGVNMTEALPGILAGGYAGTRLFGKPQLFIETEQFVNRKWAFNGPGSRTLESSIKRPDGRIDMLALDDAIGGARLDTALPHETARAVDLLKMRLSRPVKGSSTKPEVNLGFRDREAFLRQHTHTDSAPNGHLPSYRDIESTRHMGIINNGDKTTFYIGRMQEFESMLQAGMKPSEIRLPAQGIVLDRSGPVPTATLFESQPIGSASTGPKLIFENRVNFAEAESTLKALDLGRAWEQLGALTRKAK